MPNNGCHLLSRMLTAYESSQLWQDNSLAINIITYCTYTTFVFTLTSYKKNLWCEKLWQILQINHGPSHGGTPVTRHFNITNRSVSKYNNQGVIKHSQWKVVSQQVVEMSQLLWSLETIYLCTKQQETKTVNGAKNSAQGRISDVCSSTCRWLVA